MQAVGAVFQPELIDLMKAVLDEAAATLPEGRRIHDDGRNGFANSCVCRQG